LFTDEDERQEAKMTQPEILKMEGSLKRYLLIYSGAFVLGAILTYIFAMMLMRTGHLIYLLLVLPLFAYVFNDLVLWLRKGVRSAELDTSGLTIHQRNAAAPTRIEADQITGIYVSRFLDRTTVNIVLKGGTVKTFLGIRRYSGPRIRMTNEPYDRAQFLDFVRRATNLRRVAQTQPLASSGDFDTST
jgi:hypothetical protein